MRILIITQYFWPENFRINDLAEELSLYGHELTILTGIPSYPKGQVFPEFFENPGLFSDFKTTRIIRVPIFTRGSSKFKLGLNYLSFVFSSIIVGSWKLKKQGFDAIFVYQPSPVTVGLTAVWFKKIKKVPIIFWTLDLWPESLSSVGILNSKLILFFVEKIVEFIYSRCDLILAQSNSFINLIEKHLKKEVRIEYFPSWSENITESTELAQEVVFSKKNLNILFTGNIGEAQDFPAIIQAAEYLKNEDVRWLIVGDGRMHKWLKSEVIKRKLESKFLLLGEFPIERMYSFYNHCQTLLVSLKRDYYLSLVIPGKVQSYLMSGLPILGMTGGETEKIIKESGCGYTCEAGDGIALAGIVKKMILTSTDEKKSMGSLGKKYGSKTFDRDVLIRKLDSWLKEYATLYNSSINE